MIASFLRSRVDGLVERALTARGFANWRTAMRASRGKIAAPTTLRTRSGLQLTIRPGTTDFWIAYEVFSQQAYRDLAGLIATHPGAAVIDGGAHIGCFSMLAARFGAGTIVAYEPSAENRKMLERNISTNGLSSRIEIRPEALTGRDGSAHFAFDAEDPSSSRVGKAATAVPTVSLASVIEACGSRDVILKLDVEGAEYGLLEQSLPEDWNRVVSAMVELHEDPRGDSSPDGWLDEVASLGLVQVRLRGDTRVLERASAGR